MTALLYEPTSTADARKKLWLTGREWRHNFPMSSPDSIEIQSDGPEPPIAIPHCELSSEALRGVIEAFVLREGTDYGAREFPLEQKVAHVMQQLDRREAQLLFDPVSDSVDIVTVKPGSAQ